VQARLCLDQVAHLALRSDDNSAIFARKCDQSEVRDTYDATTGNLIDQTDYLGFRTTFAYDALGQQVGQSAGIGSAQVRRTSTKLDPNGQGYANIDGLGNSWQTTSNALSQQTGSIAPLGQKTKSINDGAGNARASVDPLGNRTNYQTNRLGQTTKSTDASGNVVSTIYDSVGNVIATVDALGNYTTYVYDALNRRIAVEDALTHYTTTVYDSADNVTATIDQLNNRTTYTYDELNRQVTMKAPDGGVTTTTYDANSNVISVANPLGNITTNAYDSLNHKTKITDALLGVTTMLYDSADNMTGLVDPVGNRTTYVFDAFGDMTAETDPLLKVITHTFDQNGNETEKIDRDGRKIDSTYDPNGRLTGQVWKDSGGSTTNTLTYTYDSANNQTSAADSHGTYTMAYDSLNRLSVMNALFGVTYTIGYDANSNRTKVQDSFGGVTTSIYDTLNRLQTREFSTSGATPTRFDEAYNARSQVTTLTRFSDIAGTTKIGDTLTSYDNVGRLTNIVDRDSTATTFEYYTYTYDLNSRATSETLNASTTTWTYDKTDQIASEATGSGTTNYTFDANGNRTMAGYTTGTANRLTNDGVYTYTYDNEGNLTKKSKGASAETWTYTYDNRNQMIGATERSTDGGGTLLFMGTYAYDVFNNRIQSDEYTNGIGTTTTRFTFLDQGQAFADLDNTNALQTRYIPDDSGLVVSRIASGAVNGLLLDHLGTLRNVINGTGSVIDSLTYDAFGNITAESNSANTGNFGFTNLFFDRGLGDNIAQRRVYDPRSGRWIQEDPIQINSGEVDWQRYAGNNPTNATDPSGLKQFNFEATSTAKSAQVGPNLEYKVTYENSEDKQKYGKIQITVPGKNGFTGEVEASTVGVAYSWKNTKTERTTERKGGIYIGYNGENAKDVDWVQVAYTKIVVDKTVKGKREILDDWYYPPLAANTTAGVVETSIGKDINRFVDRNIMYPGNPFYSVGNSGGISVKGDRSWLTDQTETAAGFLRIFWAKYKDALPDVATVTVTNYFTSYAIIEGKAFARVSWTTSAEWKNGTAIAGLPKPDPVSLTEVANFAGPDFEQDKKVINKEKAGTLTGWLDSGPKKSSKD
jgi:RHS repeat-associated protein